MTRPITAPHDDSILVLVDCQERLWKVIHERGDLEARLGILLAGARALHIPIVVTEQYPKGLGATIPALARAVGGAPVIEKLSFSCWGEPAFEDKIEELDRGTLVLAGIETHICVTQTALDGLADGYQVHLVADGCGTRVPANHEIGLRRVEAAGGIVTAMESVLFEWLERSDHAAFREISRLLR
jgi:nicotinamidase-related amidase